MVGRAFRTRLGERTGRGIRPYSSFTGAKWCSYYAVVVSRYVSRVGERAGKRGNLKAESGEG